MSETRKDPKRKNELEEEKDDQNPTNVGPGITESHEEV
jgi:hypothetical protein